LRSLREAASEFIWDHVVLKLQDYNYPQERLRVFIRGMHKALCEQIPPPFPPPPGIKRRLAQVLHPSLPHVPLKDMPTSKRKNLRDLEYRLKVMMRMEPHKFEHDSVVVVSLDRSQESVWGQRITIDMAPTLTTYNVWLFVLSVDLHLPREQRAFHRYLHPVERLTLQGFAKSVAENFAVGESKLVVKAAGNAYPPALIAAAIAPMLKCMIRHHRGHESLTRVAAKPAAVAFKLQKMRANGTAKKKATKKKRTVTI
jgi:site-specific DNA-cytosine methylase